MSRYRFIEAQRSQFPVRLLCQVPVVPASVHDAWPLVKAQLVGEQSLAGEEALVKVFGRHKRRYGIWPAANRFAPQGLPRGAVTPTRSHESPGLARAATLGLYPRITYSTHGLHCAPNRLLNQPKPTQANQIWVSDARICPLLMATGATCAPMQDKVSEQVVGWHVMSTMPEELITIALQRAFWVQPPTPGLLVHSDRGRQYGGDTYRKLLHDHHSLRSQSRRRDCYGNAQAEILWSRLKTEVLELRERPFLPT